MEHADVVVIGAGVMGCMVARELSRLQLDVLVLERCHDVGEGYGVSNLVNIYTHDRVFRFPVRLPAAPK